MRADALRPRAALAKSEAHETMVDLLVAHVDRAYVTAGQPGVLEVIRTLFRQMDETALTALVYELDLEAEPAAEREPGDRS